MATITTLLTAEEYAELPDNDRPTDLVQGQVIVMPPPGARHGQLCARIAYFLQRFLEDHALGQVVSNDAGVVTERKPDTVRGADVAFYSYQRVPKGPMPAGLPSVAPELVFEVLSPSDRWSEVHEKNAEYLHVGVQAVCVVDETTKSMHLFHANRPSQVLQSTDEFLLPEILPGFHLPVNRFFE